MIRKNVQGICRINKELMDEEKNLSDCEKLQKLEKAECAIHLKTYIACSSSLNEKKKLNSESEIIKLDDTIKNSNPTVDISSNDLSSKTIASIIEDSKNFRIPKKVRKKKDLLQVINKLNSDDIGKISSEEKVKKDLVEQEEGEIKIDSSEYKKSLNPSEWHLKNQKEPGKSKNFHSDSVVTHSTSDKNLKSSRNSTSILKRHDANNLNQTINDSYKDNMNIISDKNLTTKIKKRCKITNKKSVNHFASDEINNKGHSSFRKSLKHPTNIDTFNQMQADTVQNAIESDDQKSTKFNNKSLPKKSNEIFNQQSSILNLNQLKFSKSNNTKLSNEPHNGNLNKLDLKKKSYKTKNLDIEKLDKKRSDNKNVIQLDSNNLTVSLEHQNINDSTNNELKQQTNVKVLSFFNSKKNLNSVESDRIYLGIQSIGENIDSDKNHQNINSNTDKSYDSSYIMCSTIEPEFVNQNDNHDQQLIPKKKFHRNEESKDLGNEKINISSSKCDINKMKFCYETVSENDCWRKYIVSYFEKIIDAKLRQKSESNIKRSLHPIKSKKISKKSYRNNLQNKYYLLKNLHAITQYNTKSINSSKYFKNIASKNNNLINFAKKDLIRSNLIKFFIISDSDNGDHNLDIETDFSPISPTLNQDCQSSKNCNQFKSTTSPNIKDENNIKLNLEEKNMSKSVIDENTSSKSVFVDIIHSKNLKSLEDKNIEQLYEKNISKSCIKKSDKDNPVTNSHKSLKKSEKSIFPKLNKKKSNLSYIISGSKLFYRKGRDNSNKNHKGTRKKKPIFTDSVNSDFIESKIIHDQQNELIDIDKQCLTEFSNQQLIPSINAIDKIITNKSNNLSINCTEDHLEKHKSSDFFPYPNEYHFVEKNEFETVIDDNSKFFSNSPNKSLKANDNIMQLDTAESTKNSLVLNWYDNCKDVALYNGFYINAILRRLNQTPFYVRRSDKFVSRYNFLKTENCLNTNKKRNIECSYSFYSPFFPANLKIIRRKADLVRLLSIFATKNFSDIYVDDNLKTNVSNIIDRKDKHLNEKNMLYKITITSRESDLIETNIKEINPVNDNVIQITAKSLALFKQKHKVWKTYAESLKEVES